MNLFQTLLNMHFQPEIKDKFKSNYAVKKQENVQNHREGNKIENYNSTSFILTVSDDGVGVLENLEFEDIESLGFQLITTLINQLDGELELQRNNGTEFTTRFTVEEKSKNQLLGAYAVELKNQLY